MAKSEFAVQVLEAGSNNMNTYQTLIDAVHSGSDPLSIVQNTVGVVAVVTNIAPMLQPVRIISNGLVATTAMAKIAADWSDPKKRVQPGDVLTLVSASGPITLQLLVWAEIGEGVALTVAAVALAADVQAAVKPYLPALQFWLANVIERALPLSDPISTASSSLYWASMPTYTGYSLATYDEILTQKGLFVCLSDKGRTGSLAIDSTPVPGSLTPVSEDAYRESYCRYLSVKQGWSDMVSGMDYCKNFTAR
ncbi:hypothetical protein bAD24_III13465 [Burkholderia sp. AD24]|nr:hypothetical protein bAD24_III13465 [Burkholderia sp. AD24]